MVVVDVANVMGARPDGWWRDRAGAARRLCLQVKALAGRPDGSAPDVAAWVLVLEGQAREAVALLADELNELDEGLDERGPGEPALVRLVSGAPAALRGAQRLGRRPRVAPPAPVSR
jgi:hypothetical protein